MRRASTDGGFTLIEVSTVMVILGTLAAIAIPSLLGVREEGWGAQVISDVRNAAIEVESVLATTGQYPADQAAFDDLQIEGSGAITLHYIVNGARTEFCVRADHPNLPPEEDAVYAAGHAAHGAACPAFVNP